MELSQDQCLLDKNQTIINKDINALLQAELSAVETYELSYDCIKTAEEVLIMRSIHSEHAEEVNFWYNELVCDSCLPQDNSGTFGSFAKILVRVTDCLGFKPVLLALRRSEKISLKQYKYMLKSRLLTQKQIEHIKFVSIPQQKEHLFKIKQMLSLKGSF